MDHNIIPSGTCYFHYNVDENKIVACNSIFLEWANRFNEYSNNHSITFINYIYINGMNEEFIYEYFLNYILDDLFFMGYMNDNEYKKAKNIKYNPSITASYDDLQKAISRFIKDTKSYKNPELRNGNIWTRDMEIDLTNMVLFKYNYLNNKNERKEINIDVSYRYPDKNNLAWENYFMGIAKLVRLRSKDPICKVGACIVKDNKIISTGYNGFPRNIDDNKYSWGKYSDNPVENKFFYVVHAELNAILNSNNSVNDSILYVTKFPCNECVKAIIQSGISEVIYDDNKSDRELFSDDLKLYSKKMLRDAGIKYKRYIPINNSITIDL